MSNNRPIIIGAILAVVFAALALFAFTRQQQSATNEATAIANAYAASTLQAGAQNAEATAIAQANTGATAQADAQNSEATAIAQANTQGTAQADAENSEATAVMQANTQATAQTDAQNSEATAIAQANTQATAQAEAQDGEATAVAQAQMEAEAAMTAQSIAAVAQEEAVNQAATATVAVGQAAEEADIARTQVAIANESAAAASAQQEAAQATGTALSGQNLAIKQTATAQADDFEATLAAVEQQAGSQQDAQTPVAGANPLPEDTMNFLVANHAIDGFGGRIGARMSAKIDLTDETEGMTWERFAGNFSDFVVSADIGWIGTATETECGFVLREQDEDNFYIIVINRNGYLNLQELKGNEWFQDYDYQPSISIQTGANDINHVVVVAQKDQFQVFINEEAAGYFVTSTYDEGLAGVMAYKFADNDRAGCTFNNAWIWDLEAAGPTMTPILPTAVPTEAALSPYPVPLLSKTFTHPDGSFSLKYPAWWIAESSTDGSMNLSSSTDAAMLLLGSQAEEIFMTVNVFSNEMLQGMPLETLLSGNGSDLGDAFGEGLSLKFEEPEAFQFGDYDAVRIVGSSENFDAELVAYEKGKGLIFVFAVCGSGELSRCEPTVYAIAETVVYKVRNA